MVKFDIKCGKSIGYVEIIDLDAFFKAGPGDAISVSLLSQNDEYDQVITIKSSVTLVGLSEM